MRVVSVAQMRELEQRTFASGVSEDELQRRAGRAVGEAVLELSPTGHGVVALVGTGNNGRDSWIAAQRLLAQGWEACLYLCPGHTISERELSGFVGGGGRLVRHGEAGVQGVIEEVLSATDVVLDGLLGIGARGAPREPLASIIQVLNDRRRQRAGLLVVSVDTPSGVDPDTGSAPGIAVEADATVVLGGAKRGLLTPQAACWTGRLLHVDIGIVEGPDGGAEVLARDSVRGLLPSRPLDAHKGTFGRLLVLAGSERYVGAAYLVCAAAVRAGVGIVTLGAPPWLRDVVAGRLPEATYIPLADGGLVAEPQECIRRLRDQVSQFDALALGPGLTTEGGVASVVEAVLRERARVGKPAVVVDADGLNVLARLGDWPAWIGPHVVMTPHPGELRRLSPEGPVEGEMPWELVQRLSVAWGITLVIKGPFTAIGSGGQAWVHPGPNPALATGGTGDVLTGLIAGLLAQGLQPRDAALVGVWAHGAAGAASARGLSAGGLAASDLLLEIPRALAQVVAPGRRVVG